MKHIHKYKRIFLSKKKGVKSYPVWRCMITDCSHYVRDDAVIGRKSICWKCGDDFELKRFHLKRVKPTCDKCRGIVSVEEVTKNRENLDSIEATIEDMMKGLNLGFNK